MVKRLQFSPKGMVQHIQQLIARINNLETTVNNNNELVTSDMMLAKDERAFLRTERFRFKSVQEYLGYICAKEEIEMLKVRVLI